MTEMSCLHDSGVMFPEGKTRVSFFVLMIPVQLCQPIKPHLPVKRSFGDNFQGLTECLLF